MNWQVEVISSIVEYFKSIGINYVPKDNVQRCLIDFMNLKMKLVKPEKRVIYKSDVLVSRTPTEFLKALSYIENKISQGVDITFHQSKKSLDPVETDDLLNDWLIYHFHLSDVITPKDSPFYERSNYLLFVMFKSDSAYFIDVQKHKEQNVFSKQELLEIIDNNWPHLLQVHSHVDAKFLNNNYSDKEIKILRRKGYSIGTTMVNGKIIINPGLGIMTSGHNFHVVKRATSVCRILSDAMLIVENNREEIIKSVSKEVGSEVKELDLCIQKVNEWPFFRVYEKTSKNYIDPIYS